MVSFVGPPHNRFVRPVRHPALKSSCNPPSGSETHFALTCTNQRQVFVLVVESNTRNEVCPPRPERLIELQTIRAASKPKQTKHKVSPLVIFYLNRILHCGGRVGW
mmetsp:Transcript_18173/g.45391  ORF Transcript_18173/g.45391 Transcript_18173/m.45391 type:complete len:106 (+) Transcript_18173:211-528(+)